MIKKTFETLKKNPKIFLVFFAISVIFTVIVGGIMLLVMPEILSPAKMMMYDNTNFFSDYFTMMILFYLAFGFLVAPAVGNYVYEMCAGKLEKGWYKRGLERGWWKVVVLALIMIGVVFGIVLVIGLLMVLTAMMDSMLAMILIFIIYFVFIVAYSNYMIIAYTAIMAKDEFSDGLSNIFRIGNRYFFKLFGTAILAYLLPVIAGLIFSGIFITNIQNSSGLTVGYWVFSILSSLYSFVVGIFIVTYSMNQYLYQKELCQPRAAIVSTVAETVVEEIADEA